MEWKIQAHIFVVALATGFVAGVIFDIYHLLIKVLKLKKYMIMTLDILFWLIITVMVFWILLLENYGEVRFYILLGVFLGMGCYWYLLKKSFISIIKNIGSCFKWK